MEERIVPAYITDNETNTKYELDFSRETVVWAGRQGFTLQEVVDYPAIGVPKLFYYAFRKNHRNVPLEKVDKMREKWGGVPEKLVKRLMQLYTQAEATYTMQQDEDAEKNGVITLEL